MALTARITLVGPPSEGPEDLLATSLGVIFPDDVTNQHGDEEHDLLYASPHLPRPLHLSFANPESETDRRLFSQYLWNSSLLLAELIEAGTLKLVPGPAERGCGPSAVVDFDITGLSTIELGAGTALPSLLSSLLGAVRVVITDYPTRAVLENLAENVKRNVQPSFSPLGSVSPVAVEGHSWGDVSTTPLVQGNQGAFDRVFVCDCLWMPWQHANLHRSIAWFLKDSPDSRCWVVAGFHTGREKMRGFFDGDALALSGLEVERVWERDCDGEERSWVEDRGVEDISIRKRWLAVAVLRRRSAVAAGRRGSAAER